MNRFIACMALSLLPCLVHAQSHHDQNPKTRRGWHVEGHLGYGLSMLRSSGDTADSPQMAKYLRWNNRGSASSACRYWQPGIGVTFFFNDHWSAGGNLQYHMTRFSETDLWYDNNRREETVEEEKQTFRTQTVQLLLQGSVVTSRPGRVGFYSTLGVELGMMTGARYQYTSILKSTGEMLEEQKVDLKPQMSSFAFAPFGSFGLYVPAGKKVSLKLGLWGDWQLLRLFDDQLEIEQFSTKPEPEVFNGKFWSLGLRLGCDYRL